MEASSKHRDVSLVLMGFHRAIYVLLPPLLHAQTLASNYRRCLYDLHLHYQNHSNYIYIFIVCLVSRRFTGYSLIETSFWPLFWPLLIIHAEENSTTLRSSTFKYIKVQSRMLYLDPAMSEFI